MAAAGTTMKDKKERKRLGAEWKSMTEEEQVGKNFYGTIIFTSIAKYLFLVNEYLGPLARQVGPNKRRL